ncbi:MAG: cysteine--tRNA ligase [Phycisphaera sp.]|nr:cysteine--tRNA ligase [Phycisphaera sp.]
MDIQLYNTLSHRAERFEPVTAGVVRMYNCGPTVYDYAHIGNFRAFVFADVLRRFFEFVGYEVQQVMNITDVGHMTEDNVADGGGQDKMELAGQRLKEAKKQGVANVSNPDDPYEVASYFTEAFLADGKALRLKIADEHPQRMPHATAHVTQMIGIIERLIEANHAYVTDDGAVYYDVATFPEYGRLSGNTLDKLHTGAGGRVNEEHTAGKRNPADFLLWKHDASHIMKWDSPWGVGYPGWHIECSAMAMHTLGVDTLDIHTGGEDNIFPHHECEIAQSSGATGKPFANYWMHTRFLLVEGEKMSKSKGNFYTVRDLLARGVDAAVLRYELLRTHYRSNMNFTLKGLEDSQKAVNRMRSFIEGASHGSWGGVYSGQSDVERAFVEAMADDLNISAALGAVFKWINEVDTPASEDVAALQRIDAVLGVLTPAEADTSVAPAGISDEEIEVKVRQIQQARELKDYAKSDAIRDELNDAGVEVQISRDGVNWRRKMRLD